MKSDGHVLPGLGAAPDRQGLVALQHRMILKQGREGHVGPGDSQQTQPNEKPTG